MVIIFGYHMSLILLILRYYEYNEIFLNTFLLLRSKIVQTDITVTITIIYFLNKKLFIS